jgi:D-tagatose-1,6-bisphosphate aldolase subunit GatZ/KbaZ
VDLNTTFLDEIIVAQKLGKARGAVSICSAHPYVLEAALRLGVELDTVVLIEATCNQVNQDGGYTGLTPSQFASRVRGMAQTSGLPLQRLVLGGDHLGPLVWENEPAEQALVKARQMVQAYVRAGFTKIHLDASMPCAGDPERLSVETIAGRLAALALAAEEAAAGRTALRYVIGSEVPPAGGARPGEEPLRLTTSIDAAETLHVTRRAFSAAGLEAAWERVIGLIVQPGVEFGDHSVHEYARPAAAELSQLIEQTPGIVYEAHSTDYQTRLALSQMVEDHFAILKVGPALTFAFREAVFALEAIEQILFEDAQCSHIREALEQAMLANPAFWNKHYRGSPGELRFARLFSLSDRVRYYWNAPAVQQAFARLLENLESRATPLSLLSQYLPDIYRKIRQGELRESPQALVMARVQRVLLDYYTACGVAVPDKIAS